MAEAEEDPATQALVREMLDQIADKWTLLVIDALWEKSSLRFSRIGEAVGGISQKMLTQTLRQMERDGLVTRQVYPVIPPRVEYTLTKLGKSLGQAVCGIWIWAEKHGRDVEKARAAYDRAMKKRAV